MRSKRWIIATPDRGAAERLARALEIFPLTAALLVNRGVVDPADGRRFLRPDLEALLDPFLFRDMRAAVARLFDAVRSGEKIGIFGDYDVDGTSGTAILCKFFDLVGKGVSYRIPHRVNDGYGLNEAAVRDFAAEGAKVLITIDCGTADLEEIRLARELGLDVIVLDHHEPPPELPPALAILNPKVEGAGYPFTGICSTGISFKLAWALANELPGALRRSPAFQEFLLDAMSCAALGTIADVSPLVGENRVFVSYGLEALRNVRSPGLRALLAKANLTDKPLDSFDVAFKLAPRLNALGRIGTAQDVVDLLVSRSPERIESIVSILESTNRQRRGIEGDIFEQALERVEKDGLADDTVLVVADPRWHLGVVGIVAARLVERFCRPAIVLAVEEGVAKGSCRSIDGFALHEALADSAGLLVTHGGHAMAAGCSLRTENLVRFRERINAYARSRLTADDFLPKLRIDDEISLPSLTQAVVREVGRLAPHGAGNPEPLLAARNVRIAGEPRLMGKKGDHVSFYVTQGSASIRAVGFGMGECFEKLVRADTCSLAFRPHINEWNGTTSVELKLEDIRLEE